MNQPYLPGHYRQLDQFEQPVGLSERFTTFVDRQIRAGYQLEVRDGASVEGYSKHNSDPEVHYPASHGNVGAHYSTSSDSRRVDVRHYVQDLTRPGRLRLRMHSAYHSIGELLLVDEFIGQTYEHDAEHSVRRELPGGPQTLATLLGFESFERGLIEDNLGIKTVRYGAVGQAEFRALGQLLVGREI